MWKNIVSKSCDKIHPFGAICTVRILQFPILAVTFAGLMFSQLDAQSFRAPDMPGNQSATPTGKQVPSNSVRTLGVQTFDFVPQTRLKPPVPNSGSTSVLNGIQFQGQQPVIPGQMPVDEDLRSMIEGNFSMTESGVDGAELIRQRYPDGKVQIIREVRRDEDDNYYNHGPWKLLNRQGQILAEGQFHNGKMEGIWRRWHPSSAGGIFSSPPFRQFEGPFLSVASFTAGQLDGVWTLFDRAERKIFEIPYNQGKRDGTATWWFPNTMKMREVTFRDGLLDGSLREWDLQNQLVRNDEYVVGKRIIRQTSLYRPKVKQSEAFYFDSKLEPAGDDDWWQARPAAYRPTSEKIQHGPALVWFENGQPKMKGQYRDGLRVGQFTWWYANGQKQLQGNYEQGLKTGLWQWWHENGMKAIEGTYQADDPVDTWTRWDEQGNVLSTDELELPPADESGDKDANSETDGKSSILDQSDPPNITDADTKGMEEIETPQGTNIDELPEKTDKDAANDDGDEPFELKIEDVSPTKTGDESQEGYDPFEQVFPEEEENSGGESGEKSGGNSGEKSGEN